jgi:hypothetical protein
MEHQQGGQVLGREGRLASPDGAESPTATTAELDRTRPTMVIIRAWLRARRNTLAFMDVLQVL